MDWLSAYYDKYTSRMNRAGLPAVDKGTFYRNYVLQDGVANYEGARKKYEAEIIPQLVKKYNDTERERAKLEGDTPSFIGETGWDFDLLLDKIDTQGASLDFARDNAPEDAPVYQYDPAADTITNEAEDALDEIIARGEPEFIKPEDVTTYASKWLSKLSEMEQPGVDWAQKQVNKQVNENYAFYNPYSLGSGNQIKASEEATNNLMMNVISNRNAQALALGGSEYQADYKKNYGDYVYGKQLLAKARAGKLDIRDYRELAKRATNDQEREDFYIGRRRGWDVADMRSEAEDDRQGYYLESRDAREIASMMQAPQQDIFGQFIGPALTAVGYGLGGPLGGLAANGISRLFNTQQGSPPNSAFSFSPSIKWG